MSVTSDGSERRASRSSVEKLARTFVLALMRDREEGSRSKQNYKARHPGDNAKSGRDAAPVETGHLLGTLHELQAGESRGDTR